ncbi:unnamed protein product [Darwinula stevensoni]|uniref:Uncharacterized protein n=1 Tax=Darwinula stevensoni TaxID=69355 RepID=A0A7R8X292_9CRUS|nr:unnamed protein product [Darwinula stevensoni]CAG0883053.1 unnamed protein product [Darwinula stevensoni]
MLEPFYLAWEQRERAQRARRRLLEEQRKTRIFDAKKRLIGVDAEALERQIRERREKVEEEKRREEELEESIIASDLTALSLDHQHKRKMRDLERQLAEFWRDCQGWKREQDDGPGWDPDPSKRGPSSACSFSGEENESSRREAAQRLQEAAWIAAQGSVLQKLRERDSHKKEEEEAKERQIHRRALLLQELETRARRSKDRAIAHFNRQLAEEQRARESWEKQEEWGKEREELMGTAWSDLLMEDPHGARSLYGPRKLLPDRYRGMTPEEVTAIRKMQLLQSQNRKEENEREKKEQDSWARRERRQLEEILHRHSQLEKQKRANKEQTAAENLRLAEQQKKTQEEVNKEFTTFAPSDEFFTRFNTSSR